MSNSTQSFSFNQAVSRFFQVGFVLSCLAGCYLCPFLWERIAFAAAAGLVTFAWWN